MTALPMVHQLRRRINHPPTVEMVFNYDFPLEWNTVYGFSLAVSDEPADQRRQLFLIAKDVETNPGPGQS